MNDFSTVSSPSVIGDMAQRYGMDRRAFEATLRATIMPANTSNEQAAAFLLVAKQYSLNPFTKEIFAFPSRGGIAPVVSVDGWMKLINSHPQFDGMDFRDTLDAQGQLTAVTCRMFRKDRSHPIEVTEYMIECRRVTDTWKQWPARMLRHKATIQAARYAFGFAGIMEPDEYERMQTVEVAEVPPAVIADERKARCDEAAEQYAESIATIKAKIAEYDADPDNPDALYTVAEVWSGIPQAAQMDLWLAPSKGGVFSTHERDVIKAKLPRDAAA
jgi:phage recombination protein Bet